MGRSSALLTAALASLGTPAPAAADRPVDVQLVALNDLHGNLEALPSMTWGGEPAGGVEYLATHVARLERGVRHSFVVSAGDLVGGSPLLSAMFHDEPTVEAMNLLGLDANAVGNHELDDGAEELLRLQRGSAGFSGADFPFLAANVVRAGTDDTLLEPYVIRRAGGERIAFVGMTLEDTPSVTTARGADGLEFRDEAETVNALIPELRRRGAETVVVLLHEGGHQSAGRNDCAGIAGPIVDIVRATSPEVDLFVTGHTHTAYDCVIDGRPVTSASSYGRLVTDIDLRIDRRTGEPVEIRADNRVVSRDVPRDRRQSELIERYARIAAPVADRVVGRTGVALTRDQAPSGESSLGGLVADAQRAATGADVAFTNPGGLRADLDAGDATYGEAFGVQPFGHQLVTLTLTGAQIDALLEQQWAGLKESRILAPSSGFTYEWSESAPLGEKVDPTLIRLDGAPLDPGASYRVTVNGFLAAGGDGFTVLEQGTFPDRGGVDVDALTDYLAARSPVPTPADGRIAVTR